MVQYIQTMMRKEPITLLVMLLMIAILIFGLWDILHVVKRLAASPPRRSDVRAESKTAPSGRFSPSKRASALAALAQALRAELRIGGWAAAQLAASVGSIRAIPALPIRIAVTASSLAVSTISERLPGSAKAFSISTGTRPLAIELSSEEPSRGRDATTLSCTGLPASEISTSLNTAGARPLSSPRRCST